MSASNNYVISGSLLQSGMPFMGTDPHLHVNQLPSFWYEVAVSMHSNFLVGVTCPGVPAMVFGRNANVSWSMTFGMVDNIDIMVDQIKGNAS
jgi:penicillin amidase